MKYPQEEIVIDLPNWFYKLWNWWYHVKIPVVKKGPEEFKGTVVQGAFSVLFKPGLAKAMREAYEEESKEYKE